MRVLHVVTAYPRYPGDPIVPWLAELIRRLRQRGVDAEIITSSYRGGGNREHDGVPVHRFRYAPAAWERLTHEENAADRASRSPLFAMVSVAYIAAGIMAIRRLVRARRYDVVHVHWPVPHALMGIAAQRTAKLPMVTTYYGAELRLAARSRVFTRLLRAAARRSARNAAISRHTADDLTRLTGVTAEIIPYSIAFTPHARSTTTAERPFTVLFVGRLVARKGVPVLLEAWAQAALPNAKLVIVGGGPDRDALEARSASLGVDANIDFRGRVSDEELASAYSTADLFVLPAVLDARGDTEGLGVVLLEAMASHVPVLASAAGGITDVIVDGESGILVPPGDAAALSNALRRVAGDPALRATLAANGARRVREHFSWDAIADRWAEVYREAVRAPH
ncbi:MAG: glycosyltransferase family 4 protein [Gemmatimonadaceae bacterium]